MPMRIVVVALFLLSPVLSGAQAADARGSGALPRSRRICTALAAKMRTAVSYPDYFPATFLCSRNFSRHWRAWFMNWVNSGLPRRLA